MKPALVSPPYLQENAGQGCAVWCLFTPVFRIFDPLSLAELGFGKGSQREQTGTSATQRDFDGTASGSLKNLSKNTAHAEKAGNRAKSPKLFPGPQSTQSEPP